MRIDLYYSLNSLELKTPGTDYWYNFYNILSNLNGWNENDGGKLNVQSGWKPVRI